MSLVDDPFAALDEAKTALQAAEFEEALGELSETLNPEKESREPGDIPSGGVFVFDLETVPDESRFPRPVRVEKVKRAAVACELSKIVTLTVPQVKSWIPKLSEEQLNQLADLENGLKKPRGGVLDAIEEQKRIDDADDFEAAMTEWKKLSFSPLCCRIVALGIRSAKHHVTMLAKNDDEERELLRVLWVHVQRFKKRCGYNITAFDDAVLVFRSMILGVDATELLNRKKFGDSAAIDLMTVMFPVSNYGGGGKKKDDDEDKEPEYDIINGQSRKLKDVCRMLGIAPPVGYEMSGDKVFDLTESGDWAGIAAYVESDAVIEFELYRRLSDYVNF